MKPITVFVFALAVVAVVVSFLPAAMAATEPPADRVVVMYFHRTQRCPTCLKMGSYSEEAVKKGFEKDIKAGTVEFHYIDFQDAKNAALTKAYRVEGPSLIVAKVVKSKVARVNSLKDIWTHVRDKEAFLKYVRENVTAAQKADAKAAPATASVGRSTATK
jgi:hypothetical protein